MNGIVFYVYDENELKAWGDILKELDVIWGMKIERNPHKPWAKRYKLSVEVETTSEFCDLCHKAYKQYYKYAVVI